MSTSLLATPRRTLAERILDAFPGSNYAFPTLLRVLDPVESDEVPTAAIECKSRPRLLINPNFIARWCNTSEKLLMLVMHELHHVLLGHTRLCPKMNAVDNVVFDAVINALLCRVFPDPAYTSLMTDFYADDRFPECLLRPPQNWKPTDPTGIPPALNKPEMTAVRGLYQALYAPRGVTYGDLYDALRQHLPESLAKGIRLLGNHDDDAENPFDTDGSGEESPEALAIMRELASTMPMPTDTLAGAALSDLIKNCRVRIRKFSNKYKLRRLLRKVADLHARHHNRRQRSVESVPLLSALPACDRRTIVHQALGAKPLLHNAPLPIPRRVPAGERVHVYLDVSGSIGNLKGALCGAILECREFVHPKVHLFSTIVADIDFEKLRRGECQTTGGTNIDCVTKHIQENNIRRAVMLTDGWTGRPAGASLEILNNIRLGVALTPGNSKRDDLADVADYWEQLELGDFRW